MKTDKQSIEHKQLLTGMLLGLAAALMAHKVLQELKTTAAEAEFNHVFTKAREIAGGLRDGTIWKADVAADWTLDQVLVHAAKEDGLLNGPGKRVPNLKVELASAWRVFKLEVSKYGVTKYKEGLELCMDEVVLLSQTTSFESQLCRSLKKPLAEQTSSITKYMALYAHVPPTAVLPQIWLRAQVIVHGSSWGVVFLVRRDSLVLAAISRQNIRFCSRVTRLQIIYAYDKGVQCQQHLAGRTRPM